MILNNVNPNDLYPTEQKGPSVLGKVVYGEQTFDGAYIATNERLILNCDMNGQFYYRSIGYKEIEDITIDGDIINLKFTIGNFPIQHITEGNMDTFVSYVKEHI